MSASAVAIHFLSNMNKSELIEHLAAQHSLSKAESGRIVETLLDAIVTTVKKGGSVVIPGFGSFKQHARAARNGVNPATGAKIKIAAAKLPKFHAWCRFQGGRGPEGRSAQGGQGRCGRAGEEGCEGQEGLIGFEADWAGARASLKL